MKKIILILFGLWLLSQPALAFKVKNLPFVSDMHLGIVSGTGMGINLGFEAGFNLGRNLKLGLEVEQLMSDVNYSATINATRFGGVLNWMLWDNLDLNYHLGNFSFQSNRAVSYAYQDINYLILADTAYTGLYQAVSLDYKWGDFILTPKVLINSISSGGKLLETDFNIGRRF